MNNEINKIIISVVDKKMTGFVVIRNNSVKKYGYNDTLKKYEQEYKKSIQELVDMYKEDLSDLSEKEIIRNLIAKGKMEITHDEIITKVTIYEDEDKFKVESTNGTIEINSIDYYDDEEYNDLLKQYVNELYKTYGINKGNEEELIDLGVLKKVKRIEKVLQDNKIANFCLKNKKLVIGVLSTAIALTGLNYMIHGFKGKNKSNSGSIPTYVEATLEPIQWSTPTPEPTQTPIQYSKDIYIVNEENIFPNYTEPSSLSLIKHDINGDNTYSFYTYDQEELFDIRNADMSSVGNKVQSDFDLEGSGTYIYFENAFPDLDKKDLAYIKYFSMFGNVIIKNAYVKNNIDGNYGVNDYTGLSAYEVVRLIENDIPLHVYISGQEYYIRYSSLSNEAKNIVLNIAWTNTLPLYKQAVDYEGDVYSQDAISDIILNKYDELNLTK